MSENTGNKKFLIGKRNKHSFINIKTCKTCQGMCFYILSLTEKARMDQSRTEGAGQEQLDTGHRRTTAREEPEGHPVLCFPAEKSHKRTAFTAAPPHRGVQRSKSCWH